MTAQSVGRGERDSAQKIKRPSDPLPSARECSVCHRIKDDTGLTYGWGLCYCGSFRYPEPKP